jgi:hypothetical protein
LLFLIFLASFSHSSAVLIFLQIVHQIHFNFCRNAKTLFESGNPEQKKLVLGALGPPFILKDQQLTVKLQPHYGAIQKSTLDGLTTDSSFTTLETRINTGHTAKEVALIKNGGGDGVLPPVSKTSHK